jgi:hypothetical protein
MIFTENFRQALEEYVLLLNKKYPEKSIHELVSTRYSLSQFERSILYRGITTAEKAEKRKSRILSSKQLSKQVLHIDLFNVLYTVAAYLRGYPVYLANDSLLRDASESHGTGEWEIHLDNGLDLLMKSLEDLKLKKIVIYIDNPLKHGPVISERLSELSKITKPAIEIISDPSPDHLIREANTGIIATSDSTIIDKSSLPVFDLPRHVLESSFYPHILNLTEI